MSQLTTVPIDPASFGLPPGAADVADHDGRRALRFEEGVLNALLPGVEVQDGVIEADLWLARERSFHGLVWRAAGADFESFFVRPHQVGNPDAVQYTPNPNGVSSWQLYHGPGFWAPLRFPVEGWFTIRVAFAGSRAEVFVGDLDTPALVIGELKLAARTGSLGIQVGGPGLFVSRFAFAAEAPQLEGVPDPSPVAHPGVIDRWAVSDPFGEGAVARATSLDPEFVAARTWTSLDAESSGLANLARIHPVDDVRNTVLARATIASQAAVVRPLELGFSDRAVVFLNGRALFRGDESYRNRDYRYLGSIGWWDTVYLPLEPGPNELVIAVSEDFGGWGVQARLI